MSEELVCWSVSRPIIEAFFSCSSMTSVTATQVTTCALVHSFVYWQLSLSPISISVEICSSVVGVVSRPLAAGLRQFDTRRRFIISPVTAAVSDELRRSAHLFFIKVPACHSAPSSAALAERSRADCIQTISPRVQVSTRVRTCIPY